MMIKAVPKLTFAVTIVLFFSYMLFEHAYGQDDPNAQYIILQSDELQSGSREIEVPVEVGVWKLQFNVRSGLQAGNEFNWTIVTPAGKPLVLTEPNVSVTDPPENRTIVIWDPRPGKWTVRLSGKGRYTLSVTAQGELHICCSQLW